MDSKKITRISVFLAISIVISAVESIIPSVPIPGVKLGLAAVIILIFMYFFSTKEAFIILILRIVLTSLILGKFLNIGFYLSLSGGLTSFAIMVALKRTNLFSIYGVSVAGAIGHAVGQIVVAIFLLSTSALIYYLPVMLLISIFTGLITASIANKTGKYIEKLE